MVDLSDTYIEAYTLVPTGTTRNIKGSFHNLHNRFALWAYFNYSLLERQRNFFRIARYFGTARSIGGIIMYGSIQKLDLLFPLFNDQ